ncbi:MAG TPA: ATP-dependent RNA helicase DbpA [Dokdonella sp.]|uniref:ATP-dependent RNA helicase DbpA n=1 Tax=Dokdonella sp. TaxID=2291710 RepID=UPI002B9185D9|nr:ATP-dependent RNA helicase DbpA [Dokdonella sp.]HUD43863.1 ATP-dependent RNA helicase DbpA [Dokdonella sp.]
MTDFSTLPLAPALQQALAALDYVQMTPVQAQSLPPILDGRDAIVQARTGSGKTAAFGLGLLSAIDPAVVAVQALVLCPTRELADQVGKEIRRLARFVPNLKLLTLCGGIALRPQLASLTHPPHVVVGTPGRIQELIDLGALLLDGVRVLVLDEADRMLDMGFLDAIDGIAVSLPRDRRTLLFSATLPPPIRSVSQRLQREPAEITVADAEPAIEQRFHEIDPARRFDALLRVLNAHRPESVLVFCNTRRDTESVAERLRGLGHSAAALHGDLDQREREDVLVRFAHRSCVILTATDVAARGLDIDDLPLVISYDLASDADSHVHRIGRTGRAGRSGLAIALAAPADMPRANAIESRLGTRLRYAPLPPAEAGPPLSAPMRTLCIDAGRQDKLRPGDVVGALTGDAGLAADRIGKIAVYATRTYVAIRADSAASALARLRAGRIKGRTFRIRPLD